MSFLLLFILKLLKNNKFVRRITINYSAIGTLSPQSTYGRGKVSVSQYNNYMIVANLFSPDVIFSLQGATIDDYSILIQRFQFSAPWYAPNGTQTTQVTSTQVAGLDFDAGSVGNYTFTEANGETTVYAYPGEEFEAKISVIIPNRNHAEDLIKKRQLI